MQHLLDTVSKRTLPQSIENRHSPLHPANHLVAVWQGEAITSSRAVQTRSCNFGISSMQLFTFGTSQICPQDNVLSNSAVNHQCLCGMRNMYANKG